MTKYSEIRKIYQIVADKARDEKQALFTHYLQNHTNGVSEYFRNGALDYLDELVEKSILEEPDFQYELPLKWDVPFPPVENHSFTFIDLFAGIGGFRVAFQKQGGKCVFSSEWNKYAKRTYEANFGEVPFGDITQIDETEIPEHDILLGGFPCQPFSIAGVSKKNSLGRQHGFMDETQGTLFYDIVRIIKAKKPKAFLLENVKNLKSHDKGKTYKVIKKALRELDYITFDEVLDAKYYVPQHRERIFIAGFSREHFNDSMLFDFPKPKNDEIPAIKEILEKRVDKKYTLTDKLWQYLQDYAAKHKLKGNGFGFGLTDKEGIARTLSARYYKDGSEILIPQNKKNPRRLTPEECKRLMGYPDNFKIKDIGVSDTQLYRQFGNSVAVPLVTKVAEKLIEIFHDQINSKKTILDVEAELTH